MTPPNDPQTPGAAQDPGPSYVRRLLHRWLVEYNPLYILSAALVLAGTFLCSRGLALEESRYGPLGVAAISEIYAGCLIGGAALLTRIGQRRPAVMLALLTLLYQWDLTLHTERTPYLGPLAATAWVVVFAAKLHGLAWAVRLRLSRAAAGAAILAGAGLAFFPLRMHDLQEREALLAVWAFATASLLRSAEVTSRVPLDAWGTTVLRRSLRAAWVLSALLVAGHVLFWSTQWSIFLPALLPVAPLLLVRGARREARAWALVVATLVVTGATLPGVFSVTALLAAAALCLRALSPTLPRVLRTAPAAARQEPPYRASAPSATPEEAEVVVLPATVDPATKKRLLAGAAFAVYLSAWTLGWSGGPWPAHVLALDLALTAVVLAAAWRGRVRSALAPLVASWAHFVVQAGIVPAPRSLVQWGASAMGLGFALLLASLAASYRLREAER